MNRQRNEGNQTNSGNTPRNETNTGNTPRNQTDIGDGLRIPTASELLALLNEFNQEHPPAILVSPQDVSTDIPFAEVISQEEVVVVLDDQEQAPFASSEVIEESQSS